MQIKNLDIRRTRYFLMVLFFLSVFFDYNFSANYGGLSNFVKYLLWISQFLLTYIILNYIIRRKHLNDYFYLGIMILCTMFSIPLPEYYKEIVIHFSQINNIIPFILLLIILFVTSIDSRYQLSVKEYFYKASKKDHNILKYAPEELKNDWTFIRSAMEINGNFLEYAPEEIKDDEFVVLSAVSKNGEALKFASERLKDDREVVLTAVETSIHALEYASERLRDDKKIIFDNLRYDGFSLKYASERIKDDKEIVLAAVKINCYAFEHASERLRDDRDVVLASVKLNGLCLKCASIRLKDDKEIVLAAAKTSSLALEHASQRLKEDKEVLLAHQKSVNENYAALTSKTKRR